MTNFCKTIALGIVVASLGMSVAATSTPAAAWDFQHRNISTGFNHGQYWVPGVGWVAPPTTYDVFQPTVYEPSCYLTTQTAFGNYGFAYHATETVCY
jgi:hypothetical protein